MPESPAGGQGGAAEGAEADDPGAQERGGGGVVELVREGVGEPLVDHGVLGVAAVGVPTCERRGRGTGSRRRADRTGTVPHVPRSQAMPTRSPEAIPPRRRSGGVDDTHDLVAGHDVGAVGGEDRPRRDGGRCGRRRTIETRTRISPIPGLGGSRSTNAMGVPSIGPGSCTTQAFTGASSDVGWSRTGPDGAGRDHDHGAAGVVRHLVADRTQQQAGERPMAAGPDDDHRRRGAGLDQAAPG